MPKATRCDAAAHLGPALLLVLAACSARGTDDPAADAGAGQPDAAAGQPDSAPPAADAAPTDDGCAAGGAGLACLFALYDDVADGCDADLLARLDDELADRRGQLPLWRDGRALFVSRGQVAAVAGGFNGWDAEALATSALCGSDLFVADTSVASGRHPYKLVIDGTWMLDPENWAFEFDGFAGNADGANSVLNTYDSGLGHLVHPDVEVCSVELGNCRRFYTYLPAGYAAPANAGKQYPALFMHDGQNIFDDEDCCFGHTGWEVNVQLDADIGAGTIEPVVVVGFPHGGAARTDEYGYSTVVGGAQETFMAFQVDVVQPKAAELWRLDDDRYYVAGSSLGGLLSFRLAFTYPDVYAAAASLSGSYWVGQGDGTAMSDFVDQTGYLPLPLYMDHGGTAQSGGDNYPDNVALRDQLVGEGWTLAESPSCNLTAGALCYLHDVGASHDELAWRDRAYHFLRFLLAP